MTTDATIRLMTAADIPAGMRLKAQNGWNQLEGDWQRQLALAPDACFAAEKEGTVVGCACACVFGDVAWVNLVLVDQALRGQGLGTRLMRHVLDQLSARRVPSIRLDATPLGRPVYEKLGFHAEYSLSRFAGTLPPAPQVPAVNVVPAGPGDLAAIVALDQEITRTPREKLLRFVVAQPQALLALVRGETLDAFGGCRRGARAWQVGPCLGESAACRDLLMFFWRHLQGQPVYLDVPETNARAIEFAQSMGLSVQRQLLRMGKGNPVAEDLARFWTSFGPEKG